MSASNSTDPFAVLGLTNQAGEEEIRTRYLELVRQYPPDRAPDRFREIREAYEAAKDPLMIAKRLITPPDHEEGPPTWESAIDPSRQSRPRLSPDFLLSLGNRNLTASIDSDAKRAGNAKSE